MIALGHWWRSLAEKKNVPQSHHLSNHPSLIPLPTGYWYIFYLYWPFADLILNSEDEAKVRYDNVKIIDNLMNKNKQTL